METKPGGSPPVGAHSDLNPRFYRSGMWAWVFQRVSGVALVCYLFAHIWTVHYSQVGAKITFDRVLERLQSPLFVALDVLLLAAVVFHGLNGVRIIIMDTGWGVRRQKLLFWVMNAVGAATVAFGLWAVWPFIMGKPHG